MFNLFNHRMLNKFQKMRKNAVFSHFFSKISDLLCIILLTKSHFHKRSSEKTSLKKHKELFEKLTNEEQGKILDLYAPKYRLIGRL